MASTKRIFTNGFLVGILFVDVPSLTEMRWIYIPNGTECAAFALAIAAFAGDLI